MNTKDLRVDLTLLKKYVAALEKKLDSVYAIRDENATEENAKEKYLEFMLELSYATGILNGIGHEASLLITDCVKLGQYSVPNITKPSPDATEILNSILSPHKFGDRN